MSVFTAHDIRGRYPEQVDEALFLRIGLAVPRVLGAGTVVVGRDIRPSSEALAEALIQGLTQAGADVLDIGTVSTPMLYFATPHLKADAGVMITASHLGHPYNGCKLCRGDARPVGRDSGLAELAASLDRGHTDDGRQGATQRKDVIKAYRSELMKYADGIEPQTVVADAANGVMGPLLPKLFSRLSCELIPLFFEPDGTFPHHPPNPVVEANLVDLRAKVVETGADLGIGFDADGDRAMFVDETGAGVRADRIAALIAEEVLSRVPGGTVVLDGRASRAAQEAVEALGGVVHRCPVGHSFIKEAMRAQDAVFGAELSGHFYFREFHWADNAEMALLAVLSLLGRTGRKLSELAAPLNRYRATGELNYAVAEREAALAAVENAFKNEGVESIELDGLTLESPTWWFNLRASNTEPLLRLNLEATEGETLAATRVRIETILRPFLSAPNKDSDPDADPDGPSSEGPPSEGGPA